MPAYSPGFRSLDVERENLELAVEGEVPAWLSGSLVRNGPGKFDVGGERVEHWFDGLAMLHKFRFRDGAVAYSNRFLRTDAYRKAVEEGEISGQFATSGSLLDKLKSFLDDPTDNANVNVARVGGEYVALTETPRRVQFDPETLSTRGDLDYADDLTGHHATAHLQYDARWGETVGYVTEFGRHSRYHVYRVPDDQRESAIGTTRSPGPKRVLVASLEVDEPAYLHSFALTPRYAVIVEPPFVVNPVRFLVPGSGGFIDSYRWRPERGTRFLAFERASGDLVAERRVPPFFFFHTVNAFDSEGAVVVDLVAYEDATIVENLFMDAVDGREQGPDSNPDPEFDGPEGELTRFRVPVEASGDVTRRRLYTGIELPRVAPAARLESYRYAYGQATRREGQNGLAKVNVETGEASEWWAEDCYAGEPIFVPKGDAGDGDGDGPDSRRAEDRGVVLAPVLDAEAEQSLLVVLDGETFEERARATVPHHVPFGFHGEFFPEVTE